MDTGLYKDNPFLFGKGEWRDIRELRMTVVFDKKGQNISTEVIKDDLETRDALIPIENELVA
ncbi:MAG: hypothetical protein EOP45_07280 [Sphingobacteriaceae bacterium]|nr:MAG: hypothetical protein EOP45_07280 [Sphingobacteriaceae bacterium]